MSDSPAHLLSLKVMRLSRPSLSSAWAPFYSSSPSFSAHSTASITSLQGKTPLPGHPKTLRDLTNATELLTLPSSFGSIQLGETFSSCLCVNNESKADVAGVKVRVEMQTATSKVVLADYGAEQVTAGDTLENVVHHEIKELGQHVLACTVSYKSLSGSELTFRKFYKFAVTNPLSVKTKVHAPKSPSATLSPLERDKLFLEVHIQNLTTEPIWFERMAFEAVEEWNAQDANNPKETALMQPQDMRQYIYILTPKSFTLEPISRTPGTIIPLGRLDISWRSSFGEPGRLLTSMLSRRIPLIAAPQAPVSALPPHLKKTVASPQQPPSRPTSPGPGQRPGSPFRTNSRPPSVSARPQSPVPSTPLFPNNMHNIETNLIVRSIPRDSLAVGKPFAIQFTLVLSCPLPPERRGHGLRLSLIIQHLLPPRTLPPPPPPSTNPPVPFEVYSPRGSRSPGFSTPSPTFATFNYGLAHQKLLIASQSQTASSPLILAGDGQQTPKSTDFMVALPPPFFTAADESLHQKRQGNVSFFGQSAVVLPIVELKEQAMAATSDVDSDSEDEDERKGPPLRLYTTQDFELSFVALQTGFATIGGLRLLLADDRFVRDGEGDEEMHVKRTEAQTLKEWDVVSEVFIHEHDSSL